MITIHKKDSKDILEMLAIDESRADEIGNLIFGNVNNLLEKTYEAMVNGTEIPQNKDLIINLHEIALENAKTPNELCLFVHCIVNAVGYFEVTLDRMLKTQNVLRRSESANPANNIILMNKKIIH